MKKYLLLLFFLLLPTLAFGQGSRYDSQAMRSVQGFLAPIAGATITVCTSAGAGTPCTPVVPTSPVTLCTDSSCTVAAANPFLADSNGNFGFWALPGSYKVSITATGVTGQLLSVTLPCVAGTSCLTNPFDISVSTLKNSSNTAGHVPRNNGTQYVDGVLGAADLSDGVTGTGAVVRATSPALASPTTTGTDNGAETLGSKTLTSPAVSGTTTFTGPIVTNSNITQNGGGNTPPALYVNRQIFSAPDTANNLPLGHDLVLNASGPADIYMAHVLAATTTTVSLVVGANTNFLVGSTANFGTGSGAGIVIGRNTANEENISNANWSIVDATHLTVTCAKTHSGTTDIEQVGVSIVNGGGAVRFIPNIPTNGVNPSPVRIAWGDTTANAYLMYLPNKAADAWPYNGVGFAAPLTGFSPTGQGLPFPQHGDLLLRNATSSDFIRLQSSAGGNNFSVSDTQNSFGVPIVDGTSGGTPASSGAIRLINAHQTCTDNGAGANICSGAMQTKRVASCTTAAAGSAQCNTTVTWTTAFADTNYTATCMVAVPNHDLFILDTTSAQTASAIVVAVENGPGNALATTGTLHCIAVHD